MSARKMFKELGYKKWSKKYNKNMIMYEREEKLIGAIGEKYYKIIVYFNLTDKKIQFSPYYRYSLQELKAINKQVEELGWNNDDKN